MAIPLLLAAAACAPEIPAQEIEPQANAECGFTLYDQAQEHFQEEIAAVQEGSETHLTPLVELSISGEDIDFPEAANTLVPGDLDGLGMMSYASTEEEEGFVTAYLRSTNGNSYYWDKEVGTTCTDNTFAYNFSGEDLLLTGQCEWNSTYNKDQIGTCRGNMYSHCSYEDGNRNNYDDCTILSGYENAKADIQYLEY